MCFRRSNTPPLAPGARAKVNAVLNLLLTWCRNNRICNSPGVKMSYKRRLAVCISLPTTLRFLTSASDKDRKTTATTTNIELLLEELQLLLLRNIELLLEEVQLLLPLLRNIELLL